MLIFKAVIMHNKLGNLDARAKYIKRLPTDKLNEVLESPFAHASARDFDLLSYTDKSPSPDTFERLVSAVNPDEIERCLISYGRMSLDTLSEKQVVIDGKKLRGTPPKFKGPKGDYLKNAYFN